MTTTQIPLHETIIIIIITHSSIRPFACNNYNWSLQRFAGLSFSLILYLFVISNCNILVKNHNNFNNNLRVRWYSVTCLVIVLVASTAPGVASR